MLVLVIHILTTKINEMPIEIRFILLFSCPLKMAAAICTLIFFWLHSNIKKGKSLYLHITHLSFYPIVITQRL